MEGVIKNCSHQIKVAIEFLEEILVPSRKRAEKEELIGNLKKTLHLCQPFTAGTKPTTANIPQPPAALLPPPTDADENIYDDSEPVVPDEAVYDDNVAGAADDIYEDNVIGADDVYEDNVIGGGDSQIYEDNVIGSGGQDVYEDSVIGDPASSAPTHGEQAACEDLKNIRIASLLEYKKSSNILKSSWCRRWCVISDDFFYIYDSANDKKPKDCFSLKAYTVDTSEGISNERKRKGRCFTLRSNLSNKTYDLCASDPSSLLGWTQQLESVIGIVNTTTVETVGETADDTYNDVVISPNDRTIHEGSVQMKKDSKIFQSLVKRWCILKPLQIDIYEISKDGSKKYKSKFPIANCSVVDGKKNSFTVQDKDDSKRNLELWAPSEEDYKIWTDSLKKTFGDDLIPEDIYDDTTGVGADGAELIYDDTEAGIQTNDADILDEDIYDVAEGVMEPEDIYDDVMNGPEPDRPSLPSLPAAAAGSQFQFPASTPISRQALPAAPKALPSVPIKSLPTTPKFVPAPPVPNQTRPTIPQPDERENRAGSVSAAPFGTEMSETVVENDSCEIDYSSFYQGMWDCPADEDNELSFKRGDLIQIISKEHDCFGWWLGKIEELSGFVPKVFLMTAYEI